MLAQSEAVRGHNLPSPRLTGWGAACLAVWVGLPLLGVLTLLDALLYLQVTQVLGRCYGIFCLLG